MKVLTISLCVILLTLTNGGPVKDFINGNNLFTADVYKEQIKSAHGNILVSPFSAEIVLALTQSGAKDETAKEIRTTLHLPNTDEKTKSGIQSYLTSLKPNSDDYSLHSANKIYVKKNLTLKDEFKRVATDVYKAGFESINFAQKTQAVKTINDWVEKQTRNKIHNLLEPSHLGPTTAVVLVNALYFKGRWILEFDKDSTKKSNFYKTPSDVVQVDTMHMKKEVLGYFESPKLKAKFLELPFRGSGVALVIALPDEKDGLTSLEANAHEVFAKRRFAREPVNVALPKFKIENKIDFKEILTKLGVTKLFTNQADLSGIAGHKGDLIVSEVLQKTFIDVNEEGVEAAAATAVLANLGSMFVIQRPKQFIVDHPFIFYITVDDVVMFAGRVVDPSQ